MAEHAANEEPANEDELLAAGAFSAWLGGMQAALRGEQGSDVPCGTCTACCTSSQFVHIEPDETDTLAHIPSELLFPAPRAPRGHVLMGYDERGHCPMLVDAKCSIYAHRPRTCRTYDCRIFPATGVEVDADDGTKAAIGFQSRRWRFSFPTAADRTAYEATCARPPRPSANGTTRHRVRPGWRFSRSRAATRRYRAAKTTGYLRERGGEAVAFAGDGRAVDLQAFHVLRDRAAARRDRVRVDERHHVVGDAVFDEPGGALDAPAG